MGHGQVSLKFKDMSPEEYYTQSTMLHHQVNNLCVFLISNFRFYSKSNVFVQIAGKEIIKK